MGTYVMSDLHGGYELFQRMLKKIEFSSSDRLIILGDLIDRQPGSIELLLEVMKRDNVEVIAGNHCVMAIECLSFLMQEITDENISAMDDDTLDKLTLWMANGGQYTLNEFIQCDRKKQMKIINYLSNLKVYDEIIVNGKTFVLVHGGLGNFSIEKDLSDYTLDELVWERADYSKTYFNDKYLITGHTPTLYIEENPKPGYIYQGNRHIALDCGCFLRDGRLGAIRLDDMKEFYIKKKER